MNTRIVKCQVMDEYVIGAGVPLGAEGSHDDVLLELTFSDLWQGLTKSITWWNALGENPVRTILTIEHIDTDNTNVYRVPVPAEAKAVAGDMEVTIKGAYIEEDIEKRATVSVTAKFKVLPGKWAADAGDVQDVTPSQAEQLQSEIDKVMSDIILAVKASESEQERVANENQRIENENARKENENLRVLSEQARAEAETKRASAEEQRVQEETARETAEEEREIAEKLRKESESDREGAERARADADAERDEAEKARSEAEQERDANENQRIENETKRESRESDRIDNENDRRTNERERTNSEYERVLAENARQQAEAERVSTTNGIVAQATEKVTEAAEAAKNAEEIAANIGAHGEEVSATLLAGGWTGSGPYVQTVSVPGVNGNSFGNIGISISATDEQRTAAKGASMYLSAVDTDTITITAEGEKPTIDIPIVVQFGMVVHGGTGGSSGGDAPYIGENGNWYVGQTDTGVAATGPQGPAGPALAVTNTAAVGQTVKITAVDESGQPTEWEAVDMASGGGESEWKLLTSITLTEDTQSIHLTEDDDGNPFSAKEFIVQIGAVARSSVSSLKIAKAGYSTGSVEPSISVSEVFIQTNSFGNTSAARYYVFRRTREAGLNKTEFVENNKDIFGGVGPIASGVYHDGTQFDTVLYDEAISDLLFYATNGFLAGDKVFVYGR